jgi:hypothetical protein
MVATNGHDGMRHKWFAYAAAGWAFIFGVFHVIWANGWYLLLADQEGAKAAFAKPFTWWYDVVVAGMCLVAVPVALALAQPWGDRIPRRLLAAIAWFGTSLLALRAIASVIQLIYLIVTRGSMPRLGVWEPWFYLGATLWCLNLWHWRRAQPRV